MIEKISHNKKVIAIIMRKGYKHDGIQFLSPGKYLLQLGSMSRPEGYIIQPHVHKPVKRSTIGTQEVLFVKSGRIRIDFYSDGHVFLKSRELSPGDTILLAGAGHGIEVLKKAVIIEVKNGPFIEGADKVKFEPKKVRK